MDANEAIVRILRGQAWERAKGELMAVQRAFAGPLAAQPGQFSRLAEVIDEFIEDVEGEGLAD